MTSPKEIIKHYDIKPRKKLGQSFLMDQNIIKKIAAAAQINQEDIVDYYRGAAKKLNASLYEDSIFIQTKEK